MEKASQHWMVAVVRAAGLGGETPIPDGTSPAEAWRRAGEVIGLDEWGIARLVAAHHGLEVAQFQGTDPHAHKLLPGRAATRHQVLPLRYTDLSFHVATADPLAPQAEEDLAQLTARHVVFEIAPPAALAAAIADTYGEAGKGAGSPASGADARDAGTTVLVVDDDADARTLLRAALEVSGFSVTEASGGAEALARLGDRNSRVALVTLDLFMEGMGGLEVLRKIRGDLATADIPVVVATGADDPAVEMDLFDAGADDFVVKPIDPRRFVLRVQAVLRRRSRGLFGGMI